MRRRVVAIRQSVLIHPLESTPATPAPTTAAAPAAASTSSPKSRRRRRAGDGVAARKLVDAVELPRHRPGAVGVDRLQGDALLVACVDPRGQFDQVVQRDGDVWGVLARRPDQVGVQDP